ncbi:alpha/beta hydrolase [Belliella marina]|uniref:Alpha/beta hydrolase n=1 Tax=Belliella marina TaxID=1644146 RepID=A0ABW4VK27_9BACT
MIKKNFVLLILLLMVGKLHAQSKTIDLWKGQVPGAIIYSSYQQSVDSADNWVKMRFVTDPTLVMYQAPAEKANGTAVIICPGGGYWGLAVSHEGEQVAQWLNSLGVTAFVLNYRLPNDSIMVDKSIAPLQDGQEAIRTVRRRATEWGIDPYKIGIMGFSAGGHLASSVSTHYNEEVYDLVDNTSARPDFSLLIYPVISMDEHITHAGSKSNLLGENPSPEQVNRFSNELQVSSDTPPAFLVHSMDDGAVPVQNSIGYALALEKHQVRSELHIYQSGGHGYGMGRSKNTESSWPEACSKWLESSGFLSVESEIIKSVSEYQK